MADGNAAFDFGHSNLRQQRRLACGLIPLLNLLRERGVDPDQLLLRAGLRRAELFDPAFTISFDQELAIVELALDHLTGPADSLVLARRFHLHNFSVLGLALRACPTLGESFALVVRYPRLVWGICESRGELHDGVVSFELSAGDSRAERFLLERDLACMVTVFGEGLGCELPLLEVAFDHPASADPAVYERFFACPVAFDHPRAGLRFPATALAQLLPTADALALEFYEAQCARQSAQIDEPFRYSFLVRDHLARRTPPPGLDALARLLGIEIRSLQRLLRREGQSYSAILQSVRHNRACDRLRHSRLSIEQIAQELGFNDGVAFSRAFKTWTGLAPRQWATEQAAPPVGSSGSQAR